MRNDLVFKTGDFQKIKIKTGIIVNGEAVLVRIKAVKLRKKAPRYLVFPADL